MAVVPTVHLPSVRYASKSDGGDCMTCFCCTRKSHKVTVHDKFEKNNNSDPCCELFTLFQKLCCCCFSKKKEDEDEKMDRVVHKDIEELPEDVGQTAHKTDSRVADKKKIKALKKQLSIAKFYLDLNNINMPLRESSSSSSSSEIQPETLISCKVIKDHKEEVFKEQKLQKYLQLLGLEPVIIEEVISRVKGRLINELRITSDELREILLQQLKQMNVKVRKPSITTKLEAAQKEDILYDLLEKRIDKIPIKQLDELAEVISRSKHHTHTNIIIDD